MLRRFLIPREARDVCGVLWRRAPPLRAVPYAACLASTGTNSSDDREPNAAIVARETAKGEARRDPNRLTLKHGVDVPTTSGDVFSACSQHEQWERGIEPTDATRQAAIKACAETHNRTRAARILDDSFNYSSTEEMTSASGATTIESESARRVDDGEDGGPTAGSTTTATADGPPSRPRANCDSRWDSSLARLSRFLAREGHCRVPGPHTEDGFPLGKWVTRQRTARRKGALSTARTERLDALGMVWDGRAWTPLTWDESFKLLERFHEREGHCRVPGPHTEDGFPLGKWVTRQRTARRKGALSTARTERLDALGMVWDGRAWTPLTWDESFKLLERFHEREGHCRVPSAHAEGGRALGMWVHGQRMAHRKGALSRVRTERLNALGMVWDLWDDSFALLSRYCDREGHCDVPHRHVEADGRALGLWVGSQRTAYRRGALSAARAKQLDTLGMIWDARVRAPLTWDASFALLSRFHEREGHCRVPQKHVEDGRALGTWVDWQRRARRMGALSRARTERLDALGMVWAVREGTPHERWDAAFVRLTRFAEREGHCAVPQHHVEDGVKLGGWVYEQRRRQGVLDPARLARLEALASWDWDGRAAVNSACWEGHFKRLRQFHAREGHCSVPYNDHGGPANLRTWLNLQRRQLKDGTLLVTRKRRLKPLGVLEEDCFPRHRSPPRQRRHRLWGALGGAGGDTEEQEEARART